MIFSGAIINFDLWLRWAIFKGVFDDPRSRFNFSFFEAEVSSAALTIGRDRQRRLHLAVFTKRAGDFLRLTPFFPEKPEGQNWKREKCSEKRPNNRSRRGLGYPFFGV